MPHLGVTKLSFWIFHPKGHILDFTYWEELHSYKLHQLILTHRHKFASVAALLLPPCSPFSVCNFHTDGKEKYDNILALRRQCKWGKRFEHKIIWCSYAQGVATQRPVSNTYMLLPVREDLPEAREELNPGPLGQRRGDVTKLDQSVQKSPRLTQSRERWQPLTQLGNSVFNPCLRGLKSTADLLYYWAVNCIWLMSLAIISSWFYS